MLSTPTSPTTRTTPPNLGSPYRTPQSQTTTSGEDLWEKVRHIPHTSITPPDAVSTQDNSDQVRSGQMMLDDGTQLWFRGGTLHRSDGPAVLHPHGEGEWWFAGDPTVEPDLCSTIMNTFITPEELTELCGHSDPVVRRLAVSHPHCPSEGHLLFELTDDTDPHTFLQQFPRTLAVPQHTTDTASLTRTGLEERKHRIREELGLTAPSARTPIAQNQHDAQQHLPIPAYAMHTAIGLGHTLL